jgi:hypothetical protein
MPNIKFIAITTTAISISTIAILSSQQSAQDKVLSHVFSLHANSTGSATSKRNLAAGIDLSFSPEWMGGGLPSMGDGPWNEEPEMLQLFSSTPNNPRQYTGGDTEYIHYKNVTEKDGSGHTTFPPSQSPTMMTMMLGGSERPTPYPSMNVRVRIRWWWWWKDEEANEETDKETDEGTYIGTDGRAYAGS